jgi:hypothetical protein
MPAPAELNSSNDLFFSLLALPSTQERRAKVRNIGYGVRSDFELNFGRTSVRRGGRRCGSLTESSPEIFAGPQGRGVAFCLPRAHAHMKIASDNARYRHRDHVCNPGTWLDRRCGWILPLVQSCTNSRCLSGPYLIRCPALAHRATACHPFPWRPLIQTETGRWLQAAER